MVDSSLVVINVTNVAKKVISRETVLVVVSILVDLSPLCLIPKISTYNVSKKLNLKKVVSRLLHLRIGILFCKLGNFFPQIFCQLKSFELSISTRLLFFESSCTKVLIAEPFLSND